MDSYNDITPRLGMAWDVFGNGRTALKASVGKYLEGVGTAGNYAGANPTSRMPVTGGVFATGSVTRSWTDTDGDFVPDCDLLNNAANSVGRRRLRPGLERALRPERADQQLRSGSAQGLGRAAVRLERSTSPCSSRSCRARRWRSRIPADRSSGFTVTDNLADDAGRLHDVQHHRATRTRGCRTAAAT